MGRNLNPMANRVREYNLSCADQYSEPVVIFVHEWRAPSRHFINENTEGPPVDREPVAFHLKNLRGQILSRATETVCLVPLVIQEFGEAKVSQANVAIFVHQHVLRF